MAWTQIESSAYWIVVVSAFLATACWESLRPKGQLSGSVGRRWGNHALLHAICTIAAMGFLRASPVIAAVSVAGSRFGLLNKPWLPLAIRCILTILILDLVRYAVHRASHALPLLWRLHQVHHSDPDFDVSTAWRIHPIELLITQGVYLAAIAILAPPPAAVLAAELLSILESFVGHANASFPAWVEKPLLKIFVTPDMHRIHHSEEMSEQFTNLGDVFPWWDRLFGTYRAEPAAGRAGIVVGLKGFQSDKSLGVGFMLAQPFKTPAESTILYSTANQSEPRP